MDTEDNSSFNYLFNGGEKAFEDQYLPGEKEDPIKNYADSDEYDSDDVEMIYSQVYFSENNTYTEHDENELETQQTSDSQLLNQMQTSNAVLTSTPVAQTSENTKTGKKRKHDETSTPKETPEPSVNRVNKRKHDETSTPKETPEPSVNKVNKRKYNETSTPTETPEQRAKRIKMNTIRELLTPAQSSEDDTESKSKMVGSKLAMQLKQWTPVVPDYTDSTSDSDSETPLHKDIRTILKENRKVKSAKSQSTSSLALYIPLDESKPISTSTPSTSSKKKHQKKKAGAKESIPENNVPYITKDSIRAHINARTSRGKEASVAGVIINMGLPDSQLYKDVAAGKELEDILEELGDDDSNWETDSWKTQRNKSKSLAVQVLSRRSKCPLCYVVHLCESECKKREPTCFICCEVGHISTNCPTALCTMCHMPDHYRQHCPRLPHVKNLQCNRCQMNGHIENMCPDLWRQFHMTTDGSSVPKKPERNANLENPRMSCSNCASNKHFVYGCPKPGQKRDEMAAYTQIARYNTVQQLEMRANTKAPKQLEYIDELRKKEKQNDTWDLPGNCTSVTNLCKDDARPESPVSSESSTASNRKKRSKRKEKTGVRKLVPIRVLTPAVTINNCITSLKWTTTYATPGSKRQIGYTYDPSRDLTPGAKSGIYNVNAKPEYKSANNSFNNKSLNGASNSSTNSTPAKSDNTSTNLFDVERNNDISPTMSASARKNKKKKLKKAALKLLNESKNRQADPNLEALLLQAGMAAKKPKIMKAIGFKPIQNGKNTPKKASQTQTPKKSANSFNQSMNCTPNNYSQANKANKSANSLNKSTNKPPSPPLVRYSNNSKSPSVHPSVMNFISSVDLKKEAARATQAINTLKNKLKAEKKARKLEKKESEQTLLQMEVFADGSKTYREQKLNTFNGGKKNKKNKKGKKAQRS